MPSRVLPRSDDERTTALNTCRNKYEATTPPAVRLISADQDAALESRATAWNTARAGLGPLLQAQTGATAASDAAFTVLARVISHFIQVFNLAVDRGTFAPTDRAYYQLDVGNNRLPSLGRAADVELWSQRIAEGEAARV